MGFFGILAIVVIVILLIPSNSFEPKAIRLAMDALQRTSSTVPESSAEYFPPPGVMKATLKENFCPSQMKLSLQRDYGAAKAEHAAYHLLDIVGHLFLQNSKPDMSTWCLSARDTLGAHFE